MRLYACVYVILTYNVDEMVLFFRQLVEILEGKYIKFDSFDILSDEEVRHGE